MDYQLVVIRGRSGSKGPLKLGDTITTIGRQEDCQLRINSSQVSRKHCQIFEKKGHLLVKDLGSSNGTFVNGKKVQDQKVLEPGDELTIGQVKFRVERVKPTTGERPSGVPSPGDTSIAAAAAPQAAGATDEDVFDIDFDEQDTAESSPPKSATPLPPVVAGAPADAPEEDPFSPAPDQAAGEDAVAEFLLNIELDDDDRP